MKPVKPQQFAQGLQNFLNAIDDTNAKVAPFYSKLRTALNDKTLSEMSDLDFKAILAEFMDANDGYQRAADHLSTLAAPVQLLGLKSNLVDYFRAYVAATKDMTASLETNSKTVDLKKFSQSEQDQDDLMQKINHTVNRILTVPGLRG